MSSADPEARAASAPAEVRAAAHESVREVVEAGSAGGTAGKRWMVPLTAAAAVAAAACTPVAWPLLAGDAAAGTAALAAAFGQIGGVGGGLIAETVIRAWDRLRSGEKPDPGQTELREAVAKELSVAFTSSSPMAASLRAEVAGILQGVDAVKIALTTTIESTVQESGDQVRAVLVQGLRELGWQFTEFGWLLGEVNDQIGHIARAQTEIVASSRAIWDAQQRTLMQLAILSQQAFPVPAGAVAPDGIAAASDPSADEELAATLDAAGIVVGLECPYPGLEPSARTTRAGSSAGRS